MEISGEGHAKVAAAAGPVFKGCTVVQVLESCHVNRKGGGYAFFLTGTVPTSESCSAFFWKSSGSAPPIRTEGRRRRLRINMSLVRSAAPSVFKTLMSKRASPIVSSKSIRRMA